MFCIFSADEETALKINGIFEGILNGNKLEKDISDGSLIEFYPLANGVQTTIYFDQTFLVKSDKTIITDFKGGYSVHLKSSFLCPLQVLEQQRFGNCVCTVAKENGVTIAIETPMGFVYDNIQESLCTPIISGVNGFITVFFKDNRLLLIYNVEREPKLVFKNFADDFSFNDNLFTTENFLDIAKHKKVVEWAFDGSFVPKNVTISTDSDFNLSFLNEKILPFAFFEELLVGGDITAYLAPHILQNKDKLSGFFGDFLAVIVPQSFAPENSVGLLYKKQDNLFFVEYFRLEFENRLITNIKKL